MVVDGYLSDHVLEGVVASLGVYPLDTLGRKDGETRRGAYVLVSRRLEYLKLLVLTNISCLPRLVRDERAHHI